MFGPYVWLPKSHGPPLCVSEYLRHLRRLGVYLFYSRNTESRPDSVIRTIAYQLATVNYHMAAQIAAAIKTNPGAISSPREPWWRLLCPRFPDHSLRDPPPRSTNGVSQITSSSTKCRTCELPAPGSCFKSAALAFPHTPSAVYNGAPAAVSFSPSTTSGCASLPYQTQA